MLDLNYSHGRFAVVALVASVGAWADIEHDDWTSVDAADALPEEPWLVELTVTETTDGAPAYLLLRAADGEATDDAWMIPAGETRTFRVYNPDRPVSTIAIYGSARVAAMLV